MEKNTILINKKTVEKFKNIEVKGDIIVPDSKPDIVSIINTNANSYIYKEECLDGKYRFDGNIDFRIIYLADNGETKCIQTTLDFMDFVEDSNINESNSTKYRIEIIQIDTKILNERKISLCAKIKINFEFYESDNIEYFDNFDSLSDVEKLQENVTINTLVAQNTIRSSLKEDIAISEENDSIIEILKTTISVGNIENKISYNKILSKAEVNIKILYLLNTGKISKVDTNIPIMNFIDMEKVTDEDICNIDYKIRNMNFKPNENKINCQIDFEVRAVVSKSKTIQIIQDMYGIDKNVTFTQKSIQIQSNPDSIKDRVNISENIVIEDIRSLYDVDCNAYIINKTSMNNGCNYEGEVQLNIYFETGNNLNVKVSKIPFMLKMNCDTDNLEINFINKHFRLNNEDLSCDIELELKSNSDNYKEVKIIDDVKEEEYEEQNDYAMIVYFVKEGDTIWNIARDFRVTTNSIIKNNNLQENQKVNIGEKLYIMK